MASILVRIKRAILTGNYAFNEKAQLEMEADCLTTMDVAEPILNADAIIKTIRSPGPLCARPNESLHVIRSPNLDGLSIYTKGKLVSENGVETCCFLVSCKKAKQENHNADCQLSKLRKQLN